MTQVASRAEHATDVARALDIARDLVRAGVPLFVAQPHREGECIPGCAEGRRKNVGGFHLPAKWETSRPTLSVVDRWRPGWALCAVMGHAVDLVDVDPRNGGDDTVTGLQTAGMWPRSYGTASTPSGGTHDFIAPLGAGSRDNVRPGLDIKGGLPDGSSRGFAFIAPTVKTSKATGQPEAYRWVVEPVLDALAEGGDDTGEALADLVRSAKSSRPAAKAVDPHHPAERHGGPIPEGQRYPDLRSYAGYLIRVMPRLTFREYAALCRQRWRDCVQPPHAAYEWTWEEALANPVQDIWQRYEHGRPDWAAVDADTREDWPTEVDQAAADNWAPGGAGTDASEDSVEPGPPSTWLPLDLSSILDGTYVPEEPTLMPRTDGVCLLYPGRVHSFHGESESGKSMLAQAEVARVIKAGGTVCYLDFESDASVVVGRLIMMSVDQAAISERFHYLRPDVKPRNSDEDRAAYAQLLTGSYDLAIIDGVTEAAAVFGVASKDNDEFTAWIRYFARRFAQKTGAAVVQVDHVTKDPDTRGRFAIGAQAKMSTLDGSGFVIEVKEPLGVGMRGVVVMRVAKDRPGRVRPRSGPYRASDRTQESARVVVDSTEENVITVTVEPYAAAALAEAGGSPPKAEFRPTALMEKVSDFLQSKINSQSENEIVNGVRGRNTHIKKALAILIDEGYVDQKVGARNAKLHTLLAPYRQEDDPLSDRYARPPDEDPWGNEEPWDEVDVRDPFPTPPD